MGNRPSWTKSIQAFAPIPCRLFWQCTIPFPAQGRRHTDRREGGLQPCLVNRAVHQTHVGVFSPSLFQILSIVSIIIETYTALDRRLASHPALGSLSGECLPANSVDRQIVVYCLSSPFKISAKTSEKAVCTVLGTLQSGNSR